MGPSSLVSLVTALLLSLMGATAAGAAAVKPVAVTIDDLPFSYAKGLSPEERAAAFLDALYVLEDHGVVATGFANGQKLADGSAWLLELFVERGHSLGNHTYSHPDLNTTEVDQYIADILQGEESLQGLMTVPPYFRFPYLHRGNTKAKKAAVASWLAGHGYTTVPVTIDTADWRFNKSYVDAMVAGHTSWAKAFGRRYVAHARKKARKVSRLALDTVGRPMSHILLVHANLLNGAFLDGLLTALEQDGWVFVPVEEALEDPVYQAEDTYVGPNGISFLKRLGL